uniref:Uncharacterized protein n=1 Tax=Arundo donax TaxID=35708 RepID=A0A0A9APQ8_ARUDO
MLPISAGMLPCNPWLSPTIISRRLVQWLMLLGIPPVSELSLKSRYSRR